ncbi:hypothetical protein [Sphingobium xenophagum]|uniref:hypothetical protein n=1 Tax=Sphingobium xenophagum TaxID=121428 RepID=UPI0036D3CD65|tara:strand:- start:7482 stop:8099 length:618 start_codon:yes stop_codon:yes gene_type:complete
MDHDWQAARYARALDVASSPPGNSVIQLAAHGLISARAMAVEGVAWPVCDDRRILVPKEFWVEILKLTGGAYRDWSTGIFKYRRAVGVRNYASPIDVLGVEFDLAACRRLLGVPDTAIVQSSTLPQTEMEDSKRGPGRSKGDGEIDDGPHLAAMARLIEAERSKGKALSPNKAAEQVVDVLGLADDVASSRESIVSRLGKKFRAL